MRWFKWFVAGALAVPLCHQLALAVLNATGFIARAPFSMEATRPFGIPSVISLSFWGGLWGIILGLVLAKLRGPAYWAVAVIFGALAPSLVAGFVVAPLKGISVAGNSRLLMTGLIVNAAWGLGTAAIERLIRGRNT
ncbi:MAG TPA: hypothetical protein VEK57_07710 [Thermoanaerobaculia bacterium]|nr:hypothetical protein [Thermoanaerobaculia bacterium]